MFERSQTCAEDAGLVEHLKCAIVSGDVELVSRSAVERATAVGPDLRGDAECSQQAERTACNRRVRDVEVNGDLASPPEVHATGRMEEPGQLRKSIALASRGDRRELVPQIFRE
jgi:hypothetical protein